MVFDPLSFVVAQGGKKGKKSKKAAEGTEAAPEAANGKHKPSMNGDAPPSETTEGRDGEKIEVPSAAKNSNASNGPSGRCDNLTMSCLRGPASRPAFSFFVHAAELVCPSVFVSQA